MPPKPDVEILGRGGWRMVKWSTAARKLREARDVAAADAVVKPPAGYAVHDREGGGFELRQTPREGFYFIGGGGRVPISAEEANQHISHIRGPDGPAAVRALVEFPVGYRLRGRGAGETKTWAIGWDQRAAAKAAEERAGQLIGLEVQLQKFFPLESPVTRDGKTSLDRILGQPRSTEALRAALEQARGNARLRALWQTAAVPPALKERPDSVVYSEVDGAPVAAWPFDPEFAVLPVKRAEAGEYQPGRTIVIRGVEDLPPAQELLDRGAADIMARLRNYLSAQLPHQAETIPVSLPVGIRISVVREVEWTVGWTLRHQLIRDARLAKCFLNSPVTPYKGQKWAFEPEPGKCVLAAAMFQMPARVDPELRKALQRLGEMGDGIRGDQIVEAFKGCVDVAVIESVTGRVLAYEPYDPQKAAAMRPEGTPGPAPQREGRGTKGCIYILLHDGHAWPVDSSAMGGRYQVLDGRLVPNGALGQKGGFKEPGDSLPVPRGLNAAAGRVTTADDVLAIQEPGRYLARRPLTVLIDELQAKGHYVRDLNMSGPRTITGFKWFFRYKVGEGPSSRMKTGCASIVAATRDDLPMEETLVVGEDHVDLYELHGSRLLRLLCGPGHKSSWSPLVEASLTGMGGICPPSPPSRVRLMPHQRNCPRRRGEGEECACEGGVWGVDVVRQYTSILARGLDVPVLSPFCEWEEWHDKYLFDARCVYIVEAPQFVWDRHEAKTYWYGLEPAYLVYPAPVCMLFGWQILEWIEFAGEYLGPHRVLARLVPHRTAELRFDGLIKEIYKSALPDGLRKAIVNRAIGTAGKVNSRVCQGFRCTRAEQVRVAYDQDPENPAFPVGKACGIWDGKTGGGPEGGPRVATEGGPRVTTLDELWGWGDDRGADDQGVDQGVDQGADVPEDHPFHAPAGDPWGQIFVGSDRRVRDGWRWVQLSVYARARLDMAKLAMRMGENGWDCCRKEACLGVHVDEAFFTGVDADDMVRRLEGAGMKFVDPEKPITFEDLGKLKPPRPVLVHPPQGPALVQGATVRERCYEKCYDERRCIVGDLRDWRRVIPEPVELVEIVPDDEMDPGLSVASLLEERVPALAKEFTGQHFHVWFYIDRHGGREVVRTMIEQRRTGRTGVLITSPFPGSGKSFLAAKAVDKDTGVVVSYTNQLLSAFRQQGFKHCYSAHKYFGGSVKGRALRRPGGRGEASSLLIDEVYMLPFHFLERLERDIDDLGREEGGVPIIATGDPNQLDPWTEGTHDRGAHQRAVDALFPVRILLMEPKRYRPEDRPLLYRIYGELIPGAVANLRRVAERGRAPELALALASIDPDVDPQELLTPERFAARYGFRTITRDRITSDMKIVSHTNLYMTLQANAREEEWTQPGKLFSYNSDKDPGGHDGCFVNKMAYSLSAVGADKVRIVDEEGEEVELTRTLLRQAFRPEGTLTVHSCQGMSLEDEVVVAWGAPFDWKSAEELLALRRLIFTAVTRARDFSRLYIATDHDEVCTSVRRKYRAMADGYKQQDRRAGRDTTHNVDARGVHQLMAAARYRCAMCGRGEGLTLERTDVDLPHTLQNCYVLCLTCNCKNGRVQMRG